MLAKNQVEKRQKRKSKWRRRRVDKQNQETRDETTEGIKSETRKPSRLADIEKRNEIFEEYYKAQNLVCESEWDTFLNKLRVILPSSFRITGHRSQALELLNEMKREFVPKLQSIKFADDQECETPYPIPWYPDELAWQHAAPRSTIKKHEEFIKFHEWLVAETQVGNISRQETVSMIPPLLLDVKPSHYVLDMCASPGSKTVQLVEALHVDDLENFKNTPAGLVVANDKDSRRCHMLVHQAKRLKSPCVLVTCHDATFFPGININQEPEKTLKFDRILADVPCSGDGTIRKNIPVWQKWKPGDALGLHRTQIQILTRGAQLLKVKGRMVYSTCSFNPIENEAVIAEALRRCRGNLQLVDMSHVLPQLIRAPGLTTWKVMGKDGNWLDSWEMLTNKEKRHLSKSLWPSPDVASLNLQRCLRIYPHFQNTGGFFVAVLEKTGPISDISLLPEDTPIPKAVTTTGTEVTKNIGPHHGIENPDDMGIEQRREVANFDEELKDDDDDDDEIEESLRLYDDDETGKFEADDHKGKSLENEKKAVEAKEDIVGDHEGNRKKEKASEVKDYKDEDNRGDNPGEDGKVEGSNESAVNLPDNDKVSRSPSWEEPFIFLHKDDPQLKSICSYYGLSDDFPIDQCLVRSEIKEHALIYFVNDAVKRVLQANNAHRLRVVNTGIKAFVRARAQFSMDCPYRFHQESANLLFPNIDENRVVFAGTKELEILLSSAAPLFDEFGDDIKMRLNELGYGGVLFCIDPKREADSVLKHQIILPCWIAKVSINLLYKKEERHALQMHLSRLRKTKPISVDAPNSASTSTTENPMISSHLAV